MVTPIQINNDQTGLVELYPDWNQNSGLFDSLKQQAVWQRRTIRLFGKTHPIPRLESWVGDQGVCYVYSGQTYVASGWPDILLPVVESLRRQFGWQANGALLNYYRNGSDSMGWHSDDEPELGPNPSLAILSLGASRQMQLRNIENPSQKLSVNLTPSSLLWMHGSVQHHWQHALPKRARSEERISVTFRKIIS